MDVQEYLHKKEIKATKARVNILNIIAAEKFAICADEIYDRCKKENFNVDLSTVYRTLELLEKNKIIDKFDIGNGKYKYLLKDKGHKHTIQCKLCNKEVEYDCPMPQIVELLRAKTGFTITEGEINLKGLCESCSKQKIHS
jgi:Fe2+ or Zn2+ uptake regulation protein